MRGSVRLSAGLLTALACLSLQAADADCAVVGPCLYESPSFTIRMVDQDTGQPVTDAHALAVWVGLGMYGRLRPLTAVEALSAADGTPTFLGWGPIPGPAGLYPSLDPLVSVFRPGYRTLIIRNASPAGEPDTARVRAFRQAGRTFALVPFQGPFAEVVVELQKATDPDVRIGLSERDPASIRMAYVHRWERVRAEAGRLPPALPDVAPLLRRLDSDIQFFRAEGGS